MGLYITTSLWRTTKNKHARHLSVLAVTPSKRLGSFPNLAITEPKWCPCQFQNLSQKPTAGAPGRGRQVGRCPPKNAHFVPPNSPENPLKTAKQTELVCTLHVHIEFLMTKSPFLPSSSTICQRNGSKMAQKVCSLCQQVPKPRTGRILGYVAQNEIPRAPRPPATPRFLRFPSLRITQRDTYTHVPAVAWWSRRAIRAAHGGGQLTLMVGPPGSPGR